MEEGDSLKEQLKRIADKLDDKQVKKERRFKPFKFPYNARVGKVKAKKNFVTVIKLNDNKQIDIIKTQIDEQAIMVDGIPRLSTVDEVFYYKKNPVIILPNWSNQPFSAKESYEETVKNQMNTQGQRILLNKMKSETIKPKMGMNSTWMIIIGVLVAAGIAYYLFMK